MTDIIDKSDMLTVLKGLPEQITESYKLENSIKLKGMPDNIIFCGMGGSSIAERVFADYLKSLAVKIPTFIVEGYDLPQCLTKNSLVLIVTYSGNTEESISCFRQALRNGHNIIIITSGGKLLEYANNSRIPIIIIPKGLQPRNAIAYMFFPMVRIFENSGIISNQSAKIDDLITTISKNMSAFESNAQQIAEKCVGRMPIIYSSDIFYNIAYRWKCEFNENSKILAFCNKFPELDHNELIGYANYQKLSLPLHIIMLHDESDHRRIQKRMNITKKLIREMSQDKIVFTDIAIRGDSMMTRMFTTILLGDLTSYYLALQYQTDPTPVDIIEKLIKEIGPML